MTDTATPHLFRPLHPARGHLQEPRLRLADVPVPGGRGADDRLALRPPCPLRHGRGRGRHRRGDRRLGGRAHHPWLHRALVPTTRSRRWRGWPRPTSATARCRASSSAMPGGRRARRGPGTAPSRSGSDAGAWPTIAPSALPVRDGWHTPKAMDEADIERVKADFRSAAGRALAAGLRGGRGAWRARLPAAQLPLAGRQRRNDGYGGDLEGRMRLPLEVAAIVRDAWPAHLPVWYRVSASTRWRADCRSRRRSSSARRLEAIGIDLIDCSSGGIGGSPSLATDASRARAFRCPMPRRSGAEAEIATMAVGFITEAAAGGSHSRRGQGRHDRDCA